MKDQIKQRLTELLAHAYTPYYHFPVSAAVETDDGYVFYGVNVEDASSRAGICAERNAITSAVTNGYTKGTFKRLYLMTKSDELTFPCFVCRQLILEFFEMTDELILMNKTDEAKYLMKDILVHPFSDENLKKHHVEDK